MQHTIQQSRVVVAILLRIIKDITLIGGSNFTSDLKFIYYFIK